MERVGLTQEVVRQRGEALFRTLVQDASDVILIVGDDRQVRYATPSAVGYLRRRHRGGSAAVRPGRPGHPR